MRSDDRSLPTDATPRKALLTLIVEENREVVLTFIDDLPVAVVADSDRLARFTREAKVLAALSHQNIAAIYGLEEVDGAPYLAMELVEGDDLSVRLAERLIASVVTWEPDWNKPPAEVPSATRRLLRRCLEKDPRKRLRDIGDAMLELRDESPEVSPAEPSTAPGAGSAGPCAGMIGPWSLVTSQSVLPSKTSPPPGHSTRRSASP